MLGVRGVNARRSTVRTVGVALVLLSTLGGAVEATEDPAPPAPLAEDTTSSSSSTTTTTTSTTTTTTTLPPATTAAPTTAAPTTEPPPTAPPAPPPPPGPLCTISTRVRQDSRGADAYCLERVMQTLGYTFVGPDDWFGYSSKVALMQYQRTNGLTADGIAGPQTAGRMGIWSTSSTAPPPVGAPAPPPPAPPPPPPAACTIATTIRYNARGAGALCVEHTLARLGYSFVGPDDWYGMSSVNAVRSYQARERLYVDGVVGPQTAGRMGIWSTAVSPPPPAPAPAPAPVIGDLPANSGSGQRVVFHRGQQRVWVVDGAGNVIKTHRVSGRLYEPYRGSYSVYSRSLYTYSTDNPDVKWRYMIRFAYGPNGGRIGFHEIPTKFGVPLQSTAQLGQPLSGGCVRQATGDAQWMWNVVGVGFRVVVI